MTTKQRQVPDFSRVLAGRFMDSSLNACKQESRKFDKDWYQYQFLVVIGH